MNILENICYAKRESESLLLDIYLPEASAFSVFVFFMAAAWRREINR